MKRMLICLCAAALLCRGWVSAYSAAAYAVLAAQSGTVLDASEENQQLPMASTTKIMTGLLAAEEDDPERIIEVPASCAGIEGSSMYLKAGELLPLRDVLYGLMLCSGNDAAECIAEVCGGRATFIARMNSRAAQLGLTNTHFDNPSGLDGETHYTTALELAQLTAAAMDNELFRKVVSTKSYTSGTRTMVNHNKMLRLYEDAIGVKTGFTKTAGRCLVSAAEREGRMVVAVTLHDGNDWDDHAAMLNTAFETLQKKTWAEQDDTACEISVEAGQCASVPVQYKETLTAAVFSKEQAELQVFCHPFVYAPVQEGAVCGHARVVCGDAVLCETDLICGQTVEADPSQEDTGWRERILLWLDHIRHRNMEN